MSILPLSCIITQIYRTWLSKSKSIAYEGTHVCIDVEWSLVSRNEAVKENWAVETANKDVYIFEYDAFLTIPPTNSNDVINIYFGWAWEN